MFAACSVVAACVGLAVSADAPVAQSRHIPNDPVAGAAYVARQAAINLDGTVNAPGDLGAHEGDYLSAVADTAASYFEALDVLADRVAVQARLHETERDQLRQAWRLMTPEVRFPLLTALEQHGRLYVRDPYQSSGQQGFDCSGLTLFAFHTVDVTLAHKAAMQFAETTPIERSDAQPGDLVFFTGGDTAYGPLNIGHVGLYLGAGVMVNARAGVERVTIDRVDDLSSPAEFWSRVIN